LWNLYGFCIYKQKSNQKIMKNFIFIVLICASINTSMAQNEKVVDSKISRVTVFLNQAQVSREIKASVAAGKTDLVISGLTSNLDQRSVQLSGKGNIVILGISHRQNFISEFNMPSALKKLKDSLSVYQQWISVEQNQKDILNKEEQMLISNQVIGGKNQNLTVAELKAMSDFYRNRLTEISTAKMLSDDKIKKYKDRTTILQKQFNEQNDLYKRNTSEIVVSISANAATNVELEMNYLVSNAGWTPAYDLRALNTKSPMQLNYKANVYQNTGEEWNNVKLKLSTGNPALGGVKPELYTWYIDFEQAVVYYNEKQLRSAPAVARLDMRAEPGEAFEEVSTTALFVNPMQTTLNTEFEISLPYTVESSRKPTMVDIRKFDMDASYVYAVTPKIESDAFLLAKITGWEAYDLLPGEASVFFEGTYVGKSYIDPSNIQDTLRVSLGRDKRIVVKREKLKDFTSRATIGASQRESFAWEISVRNGKNESLQLIIEDQIPVSKNKDIEVTVIDLAGAKHDKENGMLTWQFNLKPNESQKLVYKYEVKYPKDKRIGGL
jgi:uncharacterized protein (TIGR02231 family)